MTTLAKRPDHHRWWGCPRTEPIYSGDCKQTRSLQVSHTIVLSSLLLLTAFLYLITLLPYKYNSLRLAKPIKQSSSSDSTLLLERFKVSNVFNSIKVLAFSVLMIFLSKKSSFKESDRPIKEPISIFRILFSDKSSRTNEMRRWNVRALTHSSLLLFR